MKLLHDVGMNKRWCVVILAPLEVVGNGDLSGYMFTYEDEAISLCDRWNQDEIKDPNSQGYAVLPLSNGRTRISYFVVTRGMAKRAGLIEDKNEFGEVSP